MNSGARAGIVVGVILVLGGLFLVLRPSGDDAPEAPTPVQTEVPVAGATSSGMDHGTDEHVHAFVVKDGQVEGDRSISVPVNTEITLDVESDVDEEIHVHGYDVTAEVSPSQPADITFTADTPGTFEVEFEGSGLLLTEIEVTP